MRHVSNMASGVVQFTDVPRADFDAAFSDVEGQRGSDRDGSNPSAIAVHVRRAISARRGRDNFLPGHLFADPAWDMLLELYAAELEQIRLSTSNLCDASDVPATTALRWISTLVDEGLAERHGDPLDARRVFVRLSLKGLKGMSAYFQATRSSTDVSMRGRPKLRASSIEGIANGAE